MSHHSVSSLLTPTVESLQILVVAFEKEISDKRKLSGQILDKAEKNVTHIKKFLTMIKYCTYHECKNFQ